MSKEWPLEGYFACGGQDLLVATDCLGREFTSRTANYDLIIGLPQLDTVKGKRLLPPQWIYGPGDEDESERVNEIDFFWGVAFLGSDTVDLARTINELLATDAMPTNARDIAHISHCRFYTSLTASTDEEFDAAADDFVNELEDWWTRFTSWVSILTSQDFVRLGGYAGAVTRSGSVPTWTINADGQRVSRDHGKLTLNRIQKSPLELHDLQACVTSTGNQEPPPAEWLFIRDARRS